MLLININVSAEYSADIYGNIVDSSGVKEATDTLDSKTKQILEKNGIDVSDINWTERLDAKNIFSLIFDFIKSGGKAPFKIVVQSLGIILICTLTTHFSVGGVSNKSVQYVGMLSFSFVVGSALYSLINVSINLIKTVASFITAFVPVLAAVLGSSGRTITAASTSSVLLFACSVLSFAAAFFLAPAMSAYLAAALCAGICENKGIMRFAVTFKKISMWAFSLIVTVFLGILSIKGSVSGVQDTLSLKTLKYVLGSTVPVAGTVLSETVSNVVYSLTLLKKSAGMYAVVAVAVMSAPVLLEVIMYRISIFAISVISSLFECNSFSESIEIFDNMLSLLSGLLMLIIALFIIALGIVVGI